MCDWDIICLHFYPICTPKRHLMKRMKNQKCRYADDSVLIANNAERLQKMCNKFSSESDFGLNIRINKIKIMRKELLYRVSTT